MREGTNDDFKDVVRLAAAKESMVRMRTKLLDISKTNALVSFKHSERSRNHVRLIADTVDGIYDALAGNKTLRIESLPPRDDEPADERTEIFATRLDAARLSDEEYARVVDAIPEGADDAHAQEARAERSLRDRVREALGLPARERVPVNVADHAKRHGIDPSYELAVEGEAPDTLQTLLLPEPHERKLAGVREAANSAMSDLGVNTLFAALGFLEWYESADSDRPLIAPLLLLPVAMDRKLHYTSYIYTLAGIDGELQVNVSLSERLNNDWNLVLPAIAEDEAPSSYMERVAAIVTRHDKRWRVRPFVTVGHFAFARIAMYHDLDPAKWPSAAPIEGSEIILSMLGGGSSAGGSTGNVFAAEHDVESEESERIVPLLVTDADSSQHSAIVDALSGKSLVIEGPPGTGKSQTITNLIAAALAAGKSVLFVAEKMAALQVVKSRLDKARLGEFCLELHSGKTKRKEVIESLETRLELEPLRHDARRLTSSLQELRSLRASLSKYVTGLNDQLGNGMTGHDALWGDRKRRLDEGSITSRRLDGLVVPGIEAMDVDRISTLKGYLESFESTLEGLGENNPWIDVRNAALSPTEADPVARMAEDLSKSLADALDTVASFADLGFDHDESFADIRKMCDELAELQTYPWQTEDTFVGLTGDGILPLLERWRVAYGIYSAAEDRILTTDFGQGPEATSPFADIDGAKASEKAIAIHSLLNALAANHPALSDLSEVPGLVAKSETTAADIRDVLEFVTRVEAILVPGAQCELRFIDTALELALQLEPDLGHAAPEMVDPNSVETIREANAKSAALGRAENELAKSVDLVGVGDVAVVRGHLSEIENAGLFGFMKAKVRAARRYWKSVSKVDKADPVPALKRVVEHFDAVTAFENDTVFRSAFGRRWRGRETDFERTDRVVAWSKVVRSGLDRLNPVTAKIRSELLRMDPELIEDLATLAKDPRADQIRALRMDGGLDWGWQLSEMAASHTERATETRRLTSELSELGVTAASIAATRTLATDLEQFAAQEATVKGETASQYCMTAYGGFDDEKVAELITLCRYLVKSSFNPQTIDLIERAGIPVLFSHLGPAATKVTAKLDDIARDWEDFCKTIDLDVASFCGAASLEDARIIDVAAKLDRAAANPIALGAWTRHLSSRKQAVEAGLQDLCALREESERWSDLPPILERTWYRKLAASVFAIHPYLTGYNGSGLDDARKRFRDLDKQISELQRDWLRARLIDVPVPRGTSYGKKPEWTGLALIQHETTKKQKHIPVRRLVAQARDALIALKPCFMMSPLTVAQFLPKSDFKFDLVVIDEASQMKPEDAMGAMARGKQTIVVGDPQQLPPSKYFAAATATPADDEDDDSSDLESILDLASATFRPKRRLRWHYRSRHGSLIAFSNKHFYQDDLVVFPSPSEHMEGAGVTARFVEEGIYRNRTNLPEAQVVVAEALQFIAAFPHRSLGIVAINAVQAQLIRDEMDRAFTEHPDAEEWRQSWEGTLEPFIVRPLESVQGDERDAIFISTVYGRTEKGGTVSNNFGEINKAAGHRRLNVLFTRAKHTVRLFTSLRPEDIRATDKSSRGLQMLYEYLRFAHSGKIDGGVETNREADSDFEVMVAEMLRARGFEVVPQVGVSGFRLDLAVRDKDVPGSFLAGIECDGASYHSSKSARDRDRLRQEVLEGLGWTLYRIWSTDWYRDPRAEMEKAVEFLERLRRTRKPPVQPTFRPSTLPLRSVGPALSTAERGAQIVMETSPRGTLSMPKKAPEGVPSIETIIADFDLDLFGGAGAKNAPNPQSASSEPPPAAAPEPISRVHKSPAAGLRLLATVIDEDVGPVPPDRHILRPEIREILLRRLPESAAEFRNAVPLKMRERIDPRQMKWLEEILEILAD